MYTSNIRARQSSGYHTHIPGECWETYGSLALKPVVRTEPVRHSQACRFTIVEGRGAAGRPNTHQECRSALAVERASNHARHMGYVAVAFALLAVLFACTQLGSTIFAQSNPNVQTELITVHSGDTLWSISSDHPIQGFSTQECVNWIIEQNGLPSSTLYAGQALLVPLG